MRLTPGVAQPYAAGTVYEVGRREYALLVAEERDARQTAMRDFLLAVHGPVVWTLASRGSERHLYLWLQDDAGNREALAGLGAPAHPLGPDVPSDLRWILDNPALPLPAAVRCGVEVRPRGVAGLGRTPPRAHLRVLESGTGFRQLMAVEAYPEQLDELSLERLWWYPHPLLASLRLVPLAPREARLRLERRLQQLHAGAFLRRQKGRLPDPDADKAQEDALRLREVLVEERERLFATSFLVAAEGAHRAECEAEAARLRAVFAEMGCLVQVQLGLQSAQAEWFTPGPAAQEPPGRLLTASAIACLDLTPAAAPQASGQRLGTHIRDRTQVLRDRLRSANPMAVVLGTPGHGKSAFAKAELLREHPSQLLVVDPEGEYGRVVARLGGRSVDAVPASPEGRCCLALSLRATPQPAWAAHLRAAAAHAIDAAAAGGLDEPFWLTLDEGHLWLGAGGAEDALVDLAKRARKRGLIVTVISQNVGDFLGSQGGRLVLANAGRLTLFRQQPTDLPRLGEVLHLSDRALDFLRACRPGEALLIDEQGTVPLRIDLSEEELDLVDTRPGFARIR